MSSTEVFAVTHDYRLDEDEEEVDTKFIGVFATLADAKAAVALVTPAPGFARTPEEFHIVRHVVNELNLAGLLELPSSSPPVR